MCARLGGTGDKWWAHSVASTECARHLSARAQWPAVQSHGRDLKLIAFRCANYSCVIVDSKVVVHRRRRHQAGVRKARGALSGLSGQRHGHWCRVRAPSSARRSRPSDLFQPYISILLVLTRCYTASLQRQTSYLFSWMFVFITLCMNGVLLQRRRLDTYTAGRVRCAQGSATH